jgi:hypothetical protein
MVGVLDHVSDGQDLLDIPQNGRVGDASDVFPVREGQSQEDGEGHHLHAEDEVVPRARLHGARVQADDQALPRGGGDRGLVSASSLLWPSPLHCDLREEDTSSPTNIILSPFQNLTCSPPRSLFNSPPLSPSGPLSLAYLPVRGEDHRLDRLPHRSRNAPVRATPLSRHTEAAARESPPQPGPPYMSLYPVCSEAPPSRRPTLHLQHQGIQMQKKARTKCLVASASASP